MAKKTVGSTEKKVTKKVSAVKEVKKAEKKEESFCNPHDLFIFIGDNKEKMSSQISSIYGVEEYFVTASFKKGNSICFKRCSESFVPVKEKNNCGYTLVGKAKQYFKAEKALVAYGEPSDDQEYVYINSESSLKYVGANEKHTLYVRVYDNASGVNNDRWAVISII